MGWTLASGFAPGLLLADGTQPSLDFLSGRVSSCEIGNAVTLELHFLAPVVH